VLRKGVFTAKNDAFVLVTFGKNVAERVKCICLFKPRHDTQATLQLRLQCGLRERLYVDAADSRFWVKGVATHVQP
jgi:hypothetical protein